MPVQDKVALKVIDVFDNGASINFFGNTMLKSVVLLVSLFCASILLTACGGGDGSTSDLAKDSLSVQENEALQARSAVKFANRSFMPDAGAEEIRVVN